MLKKWTKGHIWWRVSYWNVASGSSRIKFCSKNTFCFILQMLQISIVCVEGQEKHLPFLRVPFIALRYCRFIPHKWTQPFFDSGGRFMIKNLCHSVVLHYGLLVWTFVFWFSSNTNHAVWLFLISMSLMPPQPLRVIAFWAMQKLIGSNEHPTSNLR